MDICISTKSVWGVASVKQHEGGVATSASVLLFGRLGKGSHHFADDLEHHLICSSTDWSQSHVPVVSADQNIIGESHPTPELEAGVRNLSEKSATLKLAHASQHSYVLSCHMVVCCSVQPRSQHLNFSEQFCDSEVDVLVVQQGGSECFTLPGVGDGVIDDVDHGGETDSCCCKPFLLELHHLVSEAHTLLPDDVLGWDSHIVKVDDSSVRAMHAHLADLLGKVDARGVHGQADQGFVAVGISFSGICEKTHPVSLEGIGDPHLLTIDDQIIPHSSGSGCSSCHIAATSWLTHSKASHLIPKDRWLKELLLQLMGPKP